MRKSGEVISLAQVHTQLVSDRVGMGAQGSLILRSDSATETFTLVTIVGQRHGDNFPEI